MAFNLMNIQPLLMQQQAVNEILLCNELSEQYGLTLTPAQATDLIESRTLALKAQGRIELGGGIIDKIIKAFCDSPFISQQNYAETLNELLALFYCLKNESHGLIRDDDLIRDMKKSFNSICQGSLELLSGREIHLIKRCLLKDYEPDYTADDNKDDTEDEDESY